MLRHERVQLLSLTKKNIYRDFIKLCIESNYEKTRMMAEGGQLNLNLAKVRNIPIQLPEGKEQKEIVCRVESLFSLADTVEK